IDSNQRFFTSAGTVLVFSVAEGLSVSVGKTTEVLGKHDCLQLGGNSELLEVSTRGSCCLIELTATGL
ncbi:HutD family protein, partial [Pseudomonas sp. RTB2]|nr:HutD family protein [Pseudomonas sp. RTB2]